MINQDLARELEEIEIEELVFQFNQRKQELREEKDKDIEAALESTELPFYRIRKGWNKVPCFMVEERRIKIDGYEVGIYPKASKYIGYSGRGSAWKSTAQDYRDAIKSLNDCEKSVYFVYETIGKKFPTQQAAETWLKKYVDADKEVYYDHNGDRVSFPKKD